MRPSFEPCMSCLGTGLSETANERRRTFAAIADLYQQFADLGREQHWSATTINQAQGEADRFRTLATRKGA